MSLELRDELAVRLAAAADPRRPPDEVAGHSYRLADALLLERWYSRIDDDVPEAHCADDTPFAAAVDLPFDPRWEVEPRWSLDDRERLAAARRRHAGGPGLASARPPESDDERQIG